MLADPMRDIKPFHTAATFYRFSASVIIIYNLSDDIKKKMQASARIL